MRAEFCYFCGEAWIEKGQPGACECILFDATRLVDHPPALEDLWWPVCVPAWEDAEPVLANIHGYVPPPHPPVRPNQQPECAHNRWTTLERPGRCVRCRTRMLRSIEQWQYQNVSTLQIHSSLDQRLRAHANIIKASRRVS